MPRPSSAPRIAAERHVGVAGPTSRTIATLANRSGSLGNQLRELGQQLARQVVDAGVAEVLEQLRGSGLAGARQAAQDHDVLARAVRRRGLVGALASATAAGRPSRSRARPARSQDGPVSDRPT